jgi:enoyl-CoA hydratase
VTNSEPDILFERRGVAGHVILNRPHALNAVSHDMVCTLAQKLDEWETDPAVTRIVVSAKGGRAFSAGGDLRALYDLGRCGRYEDALVFFRAEYALNARIKHYRKPYVALIDGIVMGGGVGISVHGSHRVAGDRFAFAMPEVGIGFFPDIGATWFLPRLPGRLGTYCALTGERLDAADAVSARIATHRVSSNRFPELMEALSSAVPVDALLGAFAEPAGTGRVMAAAIDRLLGGGGVEDILSRLEDCTCTDAARSEPRFCRVHADRVPYCVPGDARSRFLRRSKSRYHRQGSDTALATGNARRGNPGQGRALLCPA